MACQVSDTCSVWHTLESRTEKSCSCCSLGKGQGQAGPVGCPHLGWGWRGALGSWLVTHSADCNSHSIWERRGSGNTHVHIKISQDLWVKFTWEPLKVAVQMEERLIVSPEGICQKQREAVWYLGQSCSWGPRRSRSGQISPLSFRLAYPALWWTHLLECPTGTSDSVSRQGPSSSHPPP